MREAAADGAAVAHRAVGDAVRDLAQESAGRIGNAAVLDGRVGNCGADGDRVSVLANGGQLRDARDVDQQRRLSQAQIEHGPQRLTAGQHLGVG